MPHAQNIAIILLIQLFIHRYANGRGGRPERIRKSCIGYIYICVYVYILDNIICYHCNTTNHRNKLSRGGQDNGTD